MNEYAMALEPDYSQSAFKRWWKRLDLLQQRMLRLCLSLLVMVLCFPLYYAGLFGTQEGPLNPANIGARLAEMGVSQTHAMVLFTTLVIVAVSWNWIYNAVSLAAGHRLTCSHAEPDGRVCGAAATRGKVTRKLTGKTVEQYTCPRGHRRGEGHFHPVRKGVVSHCVWVLAVFFCLVVYFLG
jgi:hypothetical protein